MRARTSVLLAVLSLTGCQLAVEFDRSRLADEDVVSVDAAAVDAGDAGTPYDAAAPNGDAAPDANSNDGAMADGL